MAHTLDPTSQLWAKQIKREHGFLQKNIQDVASKVGKHEERIKAVESAVKAGAAGAESGVAALAKQVQAIDERGSAGVRQRIDDMEKVVNERIEDVEAGSEAVVKVVEGLQRDKQVAEEERKATLTKDKALLKRISEIEEGLKKYERNIELIGKRVNSTQIEQIKQSLAELTGQVEREGEQMARLEDSVERLETTNSALMKANERLERKLKEGEEKAARAAEAKTKEEARAAAKAKPKSKPKISSTPTKKPASPEDSASARKKSHKWAGGGADKDIIAQGADLFGIKRAPKPPASKSKPTSTSASRPPPPKPAKKTPVPKKNPVPKTASEGSNRKSHKWAGGGADRDIIAAGITQHSKYGYDTPWTYEYDTPTAKSQPATSSQPSTSQPTKTQVPEKTRFEGGKAVVRSGRGWFEVERSPSPESDPDAEPELLEPRRISAIKKLQEPKKPARVKKPIEYDADGNPIKRPRGRPRKYPRPEDSPSQSASESATSSMLPPPIHPDAKKRTADTAFELDVSDASNTPAKKARISDEDGSDTEAGAQQLSSATSRRVIYATHQPEEATRPVAPIAQMVAPKTNRREIVQLDDREAWDWDPEYQRFI